MLILGRGNNLDRWIFQFHVECPSQNPRISSYDLIHDQQIRVHAFDSLDFEKISLFEQNNLPCDHRPNRYVENNRILILSL